MNDRVWQRILSEAAVQIRDEKLPDKNRKGTKMKIEININAEDFSELGDIVVTRLLDDYNYRESQFDTLKKEITKNLERVIETEVRKQIASIVADEEDKWNIRRQIKEIVSETIKETRETVKKMAAEKLSERLSRAFTEALK